MSQPTNSPQKRIKITPKLIIGIVLVVLALIFIFQNTGTGNVRFLFWDLSMPAWIWLLIVFLCGGIAGVLFSRSRQKRKRR